MSKKDGKPSPKESSTFHNGNVEPPGKPRIAIDIPRATRHELRKILYSSYGKLLITD